ncbi:MAG: hypothetical protein H5T71_00170, partial [Chloroflexi bacterium]|nr:hypothetical protein [Chloroflexota bacterium]
MKKEWRCELTFECEYTKCSWPRYPIPPGIYEFPFSVVEYNPWNEEYGFADHGVWTLKVTAGQPPTLTLPSSKLVVSPGKSTEATVTATDPEEGWLTLEKVSGPGEFPKIGKEGIGTVSDTWFWTVPEHYWGSSWQLVGFKATDACSGSSIAYLLVHIPRPPLVLSSSVWVSRGATARTILYVQDPDSFSHSFAFDPPPGISVQVVGEQAPREEDDAWGG